MEYQVTVKPFLDTGRMRSVSLQGDVLSSQLEQILEKILVDHRFLTGHDPRQVKIKNKVERLLWCLQTNVSLDAIEAYRSEPAIDPVGERMTVDLALQYYGMPRDVVLIRLRFLASLNVLSAPANASNPYSELCHAFGCESIVATELGLATIHVPDAANLRGIAGEFYYHRRSFEVTEIKEVVSSYTNSHTPAYVICKFSSPDAAPYATALFIDDFFEIGHRWESDA